MTVTTKTATPEETREEKRRRLLDENRDRVRALDAPLRDPTFVLAIAQAEGKLLTAQKELEQLREGDPKKNRKAIKRAENQIRGLGEEVAKLQEEERAQYLLYGDVRDAIIRAKIRGDEVEAFEAETAEILRDEFGAKVIIRRGENRGLPRMKYDVGLRARKLVGIQHAYANGDLGEHPEAERRYDTGKDYGEAYEIVMGMTSTSGEGGGGFGPKGPQPRVIEAGQDFRDFCAGITQAQKDVLDRVCGKSMRLGEAAAELRCDPRTAERRLISGLDAAGRSISAERARRAGKLDEAA